MAYRRANSRLNQLWQLPLLLLSLGLFGYAAYLFIDPQPGPTIEQKIEGARALIDADRPEAANQFLNRLLQTEKLDPKYSAQIHLMIAETFAVQQQQAQEAIPAYHAHVIEQSLIAFAQGAEPTSADYLRMGRSYEVLQRPTDALEYYRKAMALDPSRNIALQKRIIELQFDREDVVEAAKSLDIYVTSPDLSDAEKSWALGSKAKILTDEGKFLEARALLGEALQLNVDPIGQGEINYHLGYCAWKLNELDDAERYLRVARDQLKIQHPLDADAAYTLGKIHQARNQPREANSFYQDVIVSHADSKLMLPARLGRGVCRILLGEDDAGLTDLHDIVNQIDQRASREKYRQQTLEGLRIAADALAARGNNQGALEVMAYEQILEPEPAASFFARLGQVYRQRADQVEATVAQAGQADQIRRTQQVQDLRRRAAESMIAYSRQLTLTDDKGYSDALWKGIELFDKAGYVQGAVAALELFVTERPDDPLAPEALLRLGRTYQASGMFDKAIAAYQRNQFRYPNSLAASKSAVPLAQAYIAKGKDSYGKAETVLFSVVENNPLLSPEAEEFREALFELAQLYYRTDRFEEAVARLEEMTERYPSDPRLGQLAFLMGDSYRKSAAAIQKQLGAPTTSIDPANPVLDINEANLARRDRLTKSSELFDRVIDYYRDNAPREELDGLYLRLSFFYRADCQYDLKNYQVAIDLYDAAAFRYQDDPSALAAYVQIVNSYCALGEFDKAKTANERAKWLLRRIPTDAFADGSFAMPKEYWEQWLNWTGASGMW